MNNEIYIQRLLDDHLKGHLSKPDVASELQQQGVPDVEEQIALHRAATVALQRDAVRAQVAAIHSDFIQNLSTTQTPEAKVVNLNRGKVISMNTVRWMYRAAVVLLIFGSSWMGYQYAQLSSGNLYAELYQPYNVNTERGAAGQVVVHDMVEQFKAKNYTAVLATYANLSGTNNREKFLAAQANHELGRYPTSVQLLREIIAHNQSSGTRLYQDEAEFYTGLGYLKMGKGRDALPWFEKIYNDPNHTFHEAVDRWTLWRLRWLK